MEQQNKSIDGSTIKIIAMAAMLIDHIGAALIGRIAAANGLLSVNWDDLVLFFQQEPLISTLFIITRLIGRIAFPIFCFLLVEGFCHTRNKYRYAFRLLLFALISEIPFDLAINAVPFETGYQNVYFTLFFGLAALIALDKINMILSDKKALKIIAMVISSVVFIYAAQLAQTDYASIGVLTIIIIYLDKRDHVTQFVNGCIVLSIYNILEVTSFLALPLIRRYSGKRGINIKYLFYTFYPAHLLILYMIACFYGIEHSIKGFL